MNEFEGYAIPKHLQEGILRYVEHGVRPGGFLTAVLNNDLQNAFARADPESRRSIAEILSWFQNNHPDLYGSENFGKHLNASRS